MEEPKVIFGIFKEQSQLESAVQRLRDSGVESANISLLMPYRDKVDLSDSPLKWLMEAGPLTFPETGPFLVAGPLRRALEDARGRGSANLILSALEEIGFPESEAERSTQIVENGASFLSVHSEEGLESLSEARKALEQAGGADISATLETPHQAFNR